MTQREIPHAHYDRENPVKPSWYHAKLDGEPAVFIVCECGRKAPLTPTHEVAPDGVVHPSVHCHPDDGGCGFHTTISLAGYDPDPAQFEEDPEVKIGRYKKGKTIEEQS